MFVGFVFVLQVTVLEQQLDERRNLAINAGHGDKSTTVKVKHHFGRAPGSPSEPADGNKKNAAGGEARQFYVNPDDKYEGHPSNGLGDPFEPMDGWIMDEVDKKGELLLEEEEEEDALNWDADGDVGSGGDGVDTLADFKVDVSFFFIFVVFCVCLLFFRLLCFLVLFFGVA